MKKQPHITEQTKNNLRIAFWSLYAQKPIEKISIKEITELAGYNRGTSARAISRRRCAP